MQLAEHRHAESAARTAGLLRNIHVLPLRMSSDDVLSAVRAAGARAAHADRYLVVATSPRGEGLSVELTGAAEWRLEGEWRGRVFDGLRVSARAELEAALSGNLHG